VSWWVFLAKFASIHPRAARAGGQPGLEGPVESIPGGEGVVPAGVEDDERVPVFGHDIDTAPVTKLEDGPVGRPEVLAEFRPDEFRVPDPLRTLCIEYFVNGIPTLQSVAEKSQITPGWSAARENTRGRSESVRS